MEVKEIIEKTQVIDKVRDSIKQQGSMIDYGIWYELMNISKQNDKIIELLTELVSPKGAEKTLPVKEEPAKVEIKLNNKK